MPQKLHHPKSRTWCLLGLGGMAMSAAIFLHEGQAGILSAPSPGHSTNNQSANDIMTKYLISEIEVTSPLATFIPHPETIALKKNDKETMNKKKLGLAILFLGALAEKS